MMKVNYNKLWKLLTDRGMSKTQLREDCRITDIIGLVEKDEEIFDMS